MNKKLENLSIGMKKLLNGGSKKSALPISQQPQIKIIDFRGKAKIEITSFNRPIAKLNVMIFDNNNDDAL